MPPFQPSREGSSLSKHKLFHRLFLHMICISMYAKIFHALLLGLWKGGFFGKHLHNMSCKIYVHVYVLLDICYIYFTKCYFLNHGILCSCPKASIPILLQRTKKRRQKVKIREKNHCVQCPSGPHWPGWLLQCYIFYNIYHKPILATDVTSWLREFLKICTFTHVV